MTGRLARGAIVLALTIAGACGCSSEPAVAPTPGMTAAQSPPSGAALDAGAFAAALKRPGTTILDVRTPREYAAGHLPGAVNADVEGDFASALADLDKSKPYAVYCRTGNRSATALDIMAQEGFASTFHLDGGITAWQAAGGDVVTG